MAMVHRVIQSEPFVLDAWGMREAGTNPSLPDSDGEYLAITFQRDGGFGVVSPIFNPRTHRHGFTWRVFQGG